MPLLETKGVASAQGFGFSLQRAGAVQAEAIDFDGTNDFLSRSTDLVGNTDGKTFTFSAWVWTNAINNRIIYSNGTDGTNYGLVVSQTNASTAIQFAAKNAAGTVILAATVAVAPTNNTFIHVLASIDLNDTANRSIYINDILQTVTWSTYTNASIDFTTPNHQVAALGGASNLWNGRLSNVFLDYTYRDMSITANRRLFVTADLKPAAGQAALNPILYLPMSDPTNPGLNTGTGGNFTLTGTVARSGRGPNQYNAPYSTFDGASDFMSRGALSGISNSTSFLLAFNFRLASNSSQRWIFRINDSIGSQKFGAYTTVAGIGVVGFDASGNVVFEATYAVAPVVGRNYNVVVSRGTVTAIYVNGIEIAGGIITNSAGVSINFAPASPGTNTFVAASFANNGLFPGTIGALWFSQGTSLDGTTRTLDKFVTGTGINAVPVELGANGELPTGTSPRVYLPMYGNNAGRNLGTGGVFSPASGPYTGARGPNEFWGNWLRVPSGAGYYIRRTAGLVGATNVNTFTCSVWFYANVAGSYDLFYIAGTVNGYDRVAVQMDNGQLKVRVAASTDTSYVQAWQSSSTSLVTNGNIYNVLVSRTGSTIQAFVNGVSVAGTASPNGSGAMAIVDRPTYVGASNDSSGSTGDFWVGEVYFNTHYTNFSQEVNRLLFRDAFGNPTNLPALILGGSVPNPLVYLRTDPASPGTNSGTGGAFTSTLNIDRGQF